MLFPAEQAFVGRDEKRVPLKMPAWEATETFDRGIWAAILISETSSVVSSVTASCNMKQVSFFFSG